MRLVGLRGCRRRLLTMGPHRWALPCCRYAP
jgi:hypothetical protein